MIPLLFVAWVSMGQASPPSLLPGPSFEIPSIEGQADLDRRIDALNLRIRRIDIHWPRPTLIMAGAGGVGLYVWTIMALDEGTRPSGGLDGGVWGFESLTLLSVSATLLLGGMGSGHYFASNARIERDELIRQRDELERLRQAGSLAFAFTPTLSRKEREWLKRPAAP
ncbi:MAG: hypothetical protein ACOZIN_15085 [Myxococcota bacterium]